MRSRSLSGEVLKFSRSVLLILVIFIMGTLILTSVITFNYVTKNAYSLITKATASRISERLSLGDAIGARQYAINLITDKYVLGVLSVHEGTEVIKYLPDDISFQKCNLFCFTRTKYVESVEENLVGDGSVLTVTVVHDNTRFLKDLVLAILISIFICLLCAWVFHSRILSSWISRINVGFASIEDLILDRKVSADSDIEYSEVKSLRDKINGYIKNLEIRSQEIAILKTKSEMGTRLTRFAHDIKSPMSAISQISNTEIKDLTSEHLKLLAFASERTLALSQDLINEYKVAVSKAGSTNIHELCSGILEEKKITNAKGFVVSFERSEESAYSSIDSAMLARIISNLINNAVEASVKEKWIGVSVVKIDGRLQIIIKDKGLGIELSVLERLRRGESLSIGKEESGSGSGIGLSSAIEYMRSVNGDLQIESTVGLGTQITLVLPKEG